jgi:hypothetical protein
MTHFLDIQNITTLQSYLQKLECDQFETFLFESFDDFTNESSLNTIRLDHQVGTFLISRHIIAMA